MNLLRQIRENLVNITVGIGEEGRALVSVHVRRFFDGGCSFTYEFLELDVDVRR